MLPGEFAELEGPCVGPDVVVEGAAVVLDTKNPKIHSTLFHKT